MPTIGQKVKPVYLFINAKSRPAIKGMDNKRRTQVIKGMKVSMKSSTSL